MFTFHSVLCLQVITNNTQQCFQKKQTFKEGKYQLVLQWLTESCRQSQSLCDKVLTHYLLGWQGNSSLFFLHSAYFSPKGQGLERFLFPLFWNGGHGWLSSTGLTAFLVHFLDRGNGRSPGFGHCSAPTSPAKERSFLDLFWQEYPVWFLHQELQSNTLS